MKIALGFLLGFLLFLTLSEIFEESSQPYIKGYKNGQIDAINGFFKYEKHIKKDSTIVYLKLKTEF